MAALFRLLWLLPLTFGLAGCDGKGPAPEKNDARPETESQAQKPAPGRLDRSHAGSPAPAVGFEDPDGEAASLADFGGTPLLVNLWATWCAPCIAEMPTLDALAGREQGKLQVLAVAQEEDRAKVEAFFDTRRLTRLEPYIDPKMELWGELKIDTLPTTILYDANGREVWRMVGVADWQGKSSAALIAEAR